MSVLAATLTTMGALVVIFFLDEKIRLNLQDFAAVVIINLGVSLLIALFFVPSLIEKIGLKRKGRKKEIGGRWQRLMPSLVDLHDLVLRSPLYHNFQNNKYLFPKQRTSLRLLQKGLALVNFFEF